MSVNDIKKYKTILIENQIASGGKISKFEANYTDHSNSKENQCRYCSCLLFPEKVMFPSTIKK